MNILITGSTGNVGMEAIAAITSLDHGHEVFAGVRDIYKTEDSLDQFSKVKRKLFDFEKTGTFESYLEGIDVLFLLRPPHIWNVDKHFRPLIEAAKMVGLSQIVFLSVQGVDSSSIIPHHKIEKLIKQVGISYTFLRPAYFMQNFTTTLLKEIKTRNRVYLPAGKAKFNLIDVKDVGEVAARVLINPLEHKNKAYDLTNSEQMDFKQMCAVLSEGIGKKIHFVSPTLFSFFAQKRKEKVPTPFIFVMIMLHFIPRFKRPVPLSDCIERLLGRSPATFSRFVEREKSVWEG